jgi:hypothetical protein
MIIKWDNFSFPANMSTLKGVLKNFADFLSNDLQAIYQQIKATPKKQIDIDLSKIDASLTKKSVSEFIVNTTKMTEVTYDLLFVYVLYCILQELGFNENHASNLDIWRFINHHIPNVIHQRHIQSKKTSKDDTSEDDTSEDDTSEDDLYKKLNGNRGWLKELWWFIFLCKGDQISLNSPNHKKDIADLFTFTSDHIKNFIQRPSREHAYRIDIAREILAFYIQQHHNKSAIDRYHWRRMMKLNLAQLISTEPAHGGSISTYVKKVYNDSK